MEFISFLVWELIHKTGFFRNKKYLSFCNDDTLFLNGDGLCINDKVSGFFISRGISIRKEVFPWAVMSFDSDNNIIGRLYDDEDGLYKSADDGESIVLMYRFPGKIKSIFISEKNTIFVCIKGALFRSLDDGMVFEKTLVFSSAESYFLLNNGMTESPDGRLVVGEYASVFKGNGCGWESCAYLYYSDDEGVSWNRSDFLVGKGANKHVHLVRYSNLLGGLIVTDGDNKKRLWINDDLTAQEKSAWRLVNRFHIQTGGYISMIEDDGKMVFGTDYMGGTNFIIESVNCMSFKKLVIPDPYRKSPVWNMLLRKSKENMNEIWAILHSSISSNIKSVLMYKNSREDRWTRVFEYDGTEYEVCLISTSSKIKNAIYISIIDKLTLKSSAYRLN
ncbi:MAG: exo-alpha-sialidase [Gammaproteobacteria bacterium]|nr:exo-alpha-sialidase [Gammaproteobacteria bacterium]